MTDHHSKPENDVRAMIFKAIRDELTMFDIGCGDEYRIVDAIADARQEESIAEAREQLDTVAAFATDRIIESLPALSAPAQQPMRETYARRMQGANAIKMMRHLPWDEIPEIEREHWLFLADAALSAPGEATGSDGITTEELDKLQFGRVLHERPGAGAEPATSVRLPRGSDQVGRTAGSIPATGAIVREAIGGMVPQGPVFHWDAGWYFCLGEANAVYIWNTDRQVNLNIPSNEWASILDALSSARPPRRQEG